jgi:hypothetical protein
MKRDTEAFPFTQLDKFGQAVRHGFVIRVKERGLWQTWGDMIFQTEDGANSTAARCIGGVCDIVPAREVIHRAGKPCSFNFRRTIIVEGHIQ